jgi:hypothetical protein
MAVLAVQGKGDWRDADTIWPWLAESAADKLHLDYLESWFWEIIARFDNDVMNGKMTLDQLIDWVRSVEPPKSIIEAKGELDETNVSGVTEVVRG